MSDIEDALRNTLYNQPPIRFALEELPKYEETGLTPDEIKYARESMKLEQERRKTKMFEVKVDTETIKHVMDACKTEKTLNQHRVVIYNCLKEFLEYRETELTPDQINEMKKSAKKLNLCKLNMIIFARNMTSYTERRDKKNGRVINRDD